MPRRCVPWNGREADNQCYRGQRPPRDSAASFEQQQRLGGDAPQPASARPAKRTFAGARAERCWLSAAEGADMAAQAGAGPPRWCALSHCSGSGFQDQLAEPVVLGAEPSFDQLRGDLELALFRTLKHIHPTTFLSFPASHGRSFDGYQVLQIDKTTWSKIGKVGDPYNDSKLRQFQIQHVALPDLGLQTTSNG